MTYALDTRGTADPSLIGDASAVDQAISIYPDQTTAHAAFDRLRAALSSCAALRAEGHVVDMMSQDPSAVILKAVDKRWTETYRVKSSVMIEVRVTGLSQQDRIVDALVRTISDRSK